MSLKKLLNFPFLSTNIFNFFVTDFCTFYKKSLKNSLIFEKNLQEFSWIPTAKYLPGLIAYHKAIL